MHALRGPSARGREGVAMAKPVRRRDPRLVVNREFRSVEEFIAEQ